MPDLTPTQSAAVRAVLALNAGRVVLGLALLLAPGRLLRAALGGAAPGPEAVALARGFAARDLALGLGPLLGARRDPRGLRGWAEAGAVADLGDVAGLLGWTGLPAAIRVPGLLVAGTATAAGVVLPRLLPRRSAAPAAPGGAVG